MTSPMLLGWFAGSQTTAGFALLVAGSLHGAVFLTIGVVYTVLLIAGKIGRGDA